MPGGNAEFLYKTRICFWIQSQRLRSQKSIFLWLSVCKWDLRIKKSQSCTSWRANRHRHRVPRPTNISCSGCHYTANLRMPPLACLSTLHNTTCTTLATQISLHATLHHTTQHPLLQISACRAPSPRLPSPPLTLTSLPSRRRLAHLRFFGERRKEILLPISRGYNYSCQFCFRRRCEGASAKNV